MRIASRRADAAVVQRRRPQRWAPPPRLFEILSCAEGQLRRRGIDDSNHRTEFLGEKWLHVPSTSRRARR